MKFNLDTKTKIGLLIMGLVVGLLAGVLLTTQKNSTPQTQAGVEKTELINPAIILEEAFVKVAEEVGPAVVGITTESRKEDREFYFRPFGDEFFDRFFKEFFGEIPRRKFRRMGIASGIIVDKDGYILTNEHVIEGADRIVVTLPDGKEFKGEIRGRDPRSDLAVIKINARNLPVAKLGDSDKVRIGQWSIAIGNPFGFAIRSPEPTVTVGVISALNRTLPRTTQRVRVYTGLIQTDAAINPGNSGGPLVNLKGEVIGINVAIFTTGGGYEGVGFAIPINTAKAVLKSLIESKEVVYGWLGINIQDLDEDLMNYFGLPDKAGVIVAQVLPDTPAERAGIKEGDIIRTYEGNKIKDTQDLVQRVGRTPIGKKVKLGILRDRREITIEVIVGEHPSEIEMARAEPGRVTKWRGIEVEELTSDKARRLGLDVSEGVVIVRIEEGSPAEEAGLGEGDLILTINLQPIKKLADYERVIKSIEGACLVRTQRGYTILKEKVG